MSNCEHKWNYQGAVYWASDRPLPGSGAHSRIYGDRYFCERCLETKVINQRAEGNTYGKPIDGTLPR